MAKKHDFETQIICWSTFKANKGIARRMAKLLTKLVLNRD
jgi:hypothetical protein